MQSYLNSKFQTSSKLIAKYWRNQASYLRSIHYPKPKSLHEYIWSKLSILIIIITFTITVAIIVIIVTIILNIIIIIFLIVIIITINTFIITIAIFTFIYIITVIIIFNWKSDFSRCDTSKKAKSIFCL